MNGKVMRPALIAGVVSGALSAIPPLSWVNAALCAWMWIGGVFAVYLARRAGAPRLTRAEGVLLGLLTGTVAGVLNVGFTLAGIDSIAALLSALNSDLLNRLQESGALSGLTGCLGLVLHLGFGAFGGALGAAWITKRRI